jgi:hypothetical protein
VTNGAMPKPFTHLLVLGVMLLMMPFSMAQEKPTRIRLKVFHDGQERPTPDKITLRFDKQTLNIPITKGAFEVPSQFLTASDVEINADIDQSHITTVIPRQSFAGIFSWEISIADKRYGKDVDYAVPEGANLHKSCIIVFIPINSDGWWMFDPHCRSKRK